VQQIAVFGSSARGEEAATGDIDILVALRPVSQRPSLGLRWFELAAELTQLLGRPVELVTDAELVS
jgi:predicted nucleotidyltransferase